MRFPSRITATLIVDFFIYNSTVDIAKWLQPLCSHPEDAKAAQDLAMIIMLMILWPTTVSGLTGRNNILRYFLVRPIENVLDSFFNTTARARDELNDISPFPVTPMTDRRP